MVVMYMVKSLYRFFIAMYSKLQHLLFNIFVLREHSRLFAFFCKKMAVFFLLPGSMFVVLVLCWNNHIPMVWLYSLVLFYFVISVILTAMFHRDLINIRNYVAGYINSPDSNTSTIVVSPLNDCALIRDGIDIVAEQLDKKEDLLQIAMVENEAVFNLISDPVVIIDAKLRVLRINRGGKLLIGSNTENLRNCAILRESSFINELQKHVLSMSNNKTCNDYQYFENFISVNKMQKFFKISIALFGVGESSGAKFVVIMNDITAYKNFEKSMSDFIANASHEIRTPLTSMVGFIETIKDTMRDDPAAVNRFLDIVLEQGNKVVELLNSLLTLSKVDFERNLSIDSYINIEEVLEEAFLHCGQLAHDKNIALNFKGIKNIPMVKASYYGILQVCNNLLVNAINHSNAGSSVEIVVGVDNNVPFADVASDRRFLFLRVEDHGCGIDAKHLNRISDRFYKVNSSSKSGSGLGLSIVKSILERHNAKLVIDSKKNIGSTFTVYLRLDSEHMVQKENIINNAQITNSAFKENTAELQPEII